MKIYRKCASIDRRGIGTETEVFLVLKIDSMLTDK